jgi:hypothetical protein
VTYRDKTFCGYWTKCVDCIGCHRAHTPTLGRMAVAAGMPVSVFLDKPNCFMQVSESDIERARDIREENKGANDEQG